MGHQKKRRCWFHGCILMALVCSLALVNDAEASWADVPLDQIVEPADVVILGKIARMGKSFTKKMGQMNRNYDVGIITVEKALKGKPGKTVQLAWPGHAVAKGGPAIAVSTDIRYRKGQRGVWILEKDKAENVYWATYPKDYQQASKLVEIEGILKQISQRKWGQKVKGLAAFAGSMQARGMVSVQFGVKNTTARPLRICTYPGDRPVRAKVNGAAGEVKVDFYEWLERARLAPCRAQNFETVQPGKTKRFDQYGQLALKGLKPGKYTVTVSFVAKRDGTKLGVKNAWSGTVSAPVMTVVVK